MKIIKLFIIWMICAIAGFSYSNLSFAGKVGILTTGVQPGHYLQWNGKPILLIGDSVTQGWMETGTNFNYKGYIDALAARGINLLMLWSYIGTDAANQKSDTRIGYDSPEIWPWIGSPENKNFDLTQFNQAYFNLLKELVGYAESKGVIVLITIHDGWTKGRFSKHPFNSALGNGPLTANSQYVELADYNNEMPLEYNSSWTRQQKNQYFQERFADKLIATLEPYSNVIYEMFNEGEWYNSNLRNQHEQHFLKFFRDRTSALLLTNTDHISGDDPHNDPKVDIVTLHGGWLNRFSEFQNGFNKNPVKPYLQSEPVPGWEGDFSVLDVRKSVWERALSGAGWVAQNDTSFGWDPNTKIVVKADIRDEVYDYIGHVARFFNNSGVNFSDMGPVGNICSTVICMAREGIEYVVYAPSGGAFTVDLASAGGKTFSVQWYNPRLGEFLNDTPVVGGNNITFTAPDTNDWVLRLSSVQLDTIPPSAPTNLRVIQ